MTNQARYKMLFDCMEVTEMNKENKLLTIKMQIQIKANHITEHSYKQEITDIKDFAEYALTRI